MTYGTLKEKILKLLDVDIYDEGGDGSALALARSLLPHAIDTVSRKAALCLKNQMETGLFSFEKGSVGVQTTLPETTFAVQHIQKDGCLYTAEHFMLIGQKLVLFRAEEGVFSVAYYAFPSPYTAETEDSVSVPFDDMTADIIAYGAAGEICHSLYPSDMTRYMRLMTEFDSRLTGNSPRMGEETVKNGLFARKRGVIR